jgi:ABC-type multidrug transport system ATPase subunit
MELKVDSVRISYNNKPVLRGAHFSGKVGEVVGLLGRNGSGKSTLLKVITRSINAEDSYVGIDGKGITTLTQASKQIAYLPQDNFLPQHEKLGTLMQLCLSQKQQTEMLKSEEIQKLVNQKCNTFSGGEARFVEILFVLYSKATFVLLDEPFNGLAPIYRDKIKSTIKEVSATKGIIITDHDYRNVLDISTKKMLLVEGRTIEIFKKRDLARYGYLIKTPLQKD